MPDGVSNVLGVIGGVIGIIMFLGLAVVYLRGSKDKGTISTLEASNKALTERVNILEDSERVLKAEAAAAKVRHEADMTALRLRIEVLEQTNEELRAQRPSAEAIEAVYTLCQSIYRDTQTLVKGAA